MKLKTFLKIILLASIFCVGAEKEIIWIPSFFVMLSTFAILVKLEK